MGILLWIIFGGIAGWLASLIYKSSFGLLGNIIVGIVGALLGGWLFNAFGEPGVTGFNLWSLLVAVLGSVVLLWLINLFQTRKV